MNATHDTVVSDSISGAATVEPAEVAPLIDWIHALLRRSAAGTSVQNLLAARRLLDIFGPDALPQEFSRLSPSGFEDEQWLLKLAAESSIGGDGTTCWNLYGPEDGASRASVQHTREQSERIADRESLALAAVAIGTAQRAIVLARRRADSRHIGRRPLIEIQSAGHRLARAAAEVAVGRASVVSACQDEDAGAGAGHRAMACAAAAAQAALISSRALVQTYGAAGTSNAEATAAFTACQSAASAVGPPAELWVRAGERRTLRMPQERGAQRPEVP